VSALAKNKLNLTSKDDKILSGQLTTSFSKT